MWWSCKHVSPCQIQLQQVLYPRHRINWRSCITLQSFLSFSRTRFCFFMTASLTWWSCKHVYHARYSYSKCCIQGSELTGGLVSPCRAFYHFQEHASVSLWQRHWCDEAVNTFYHARYNYSKCCIQGSELTGGLVSPCRASYHFQEHASVFLWSVFLWQPHWCTLCCWSEYS